MPQFRIRFWTVSDAGAVVLDQLQISFVDVDTVRPTAVFVSRTP